MYQSQLNEEKVKFIFLVLYGFARMLHAMMLHVEQVWKNFIFHGHRLIVLRFCCMFMNAIQTSSCMTCHFGNVLKKKISTHALRQLPFCLRILFLTETATPNVARQQITNFLIGSYLNLKRNPLIFSLRNEYCSH